jgi:hypothetical protein
VPMEGQCFRKQNFQKHLRRVITGAKFRSKPCERKRSLSESSCEREDNIKMFHKEKGCERLNFILQPQNRDKHELV